MPRSISPKKATRLLNAATEIFIERGYQRTQIADVARAADMGKATVYGYVANKDALFDWVFYHADLTDASPLEGLPWPSPPLGETATRMGWRLQRELEDALLLRTAHSCESSAIELAAILEDLYRRAARNRVAIKLVDRCSVDQPEFAEAWFTDGRWAQVEILAQYLRRGKKMGWLKGTPDLAFAARFFLESIAFWAIHRHWDPSPRPLQEDEVEPTLIALLIASVTG